LYNKFDPEVPTIEEFEKAIKIEVKD